MRERVTTGWRRGCRHEGDGLEPCVVLDPFVGSGTTGLVAVREGRSFVGIELSRDSAEMAYRRVAAEAPMFVKSKLVRWS